MASFSSMVVKLGSSESVGSEREEDAIVRKEDWVYMGGGDSYV